MDQDWRDGARIDVKRTNEVTDKTENSLESWSRRFSVAPMMECGRAR
jgi:hypothetical protein